VLFGGRIFITGRSRRSSYGPFSTNATGTAAVAMGAVLAALTCCTIGTPNTFAGIERLTAAQYHCTQRLSHKCGGKGIMLIADAGQGYSREGKNTGRDLGEFHLVGLIVL